MSDQELEVKYFVNDLKKLEKRVQEIGGRLVQPRIFERNLRFDTPNGELAAGYRVLRLRQDTEARMTYKGPGWDNEGVRTRQEIEFTVGDFGAAQRFLEALGYVVSLAYEKFRTTYDVGHVHVVFDEMPYGSFIELEGPDPMQIQAVNRQMGLDWESRSPESYTVLFERVKNAMGLSFRDLTFENFQEIDVPPSAFNLRPADTFD